VDRYNIQREEEKFKKKGIAGRKTSGGTFVGDISQL
jgi:hypothetical protein